jgi:Zn-dependent M28 family amino/carboxypeptidase
MRRFLLALILATGSLAQAQDRLLPNAVRATADRITAEQLKRDLDFLASDELLGRNTPSPGFDKAADYVVRRLEKAGVTPLGDQGTFYQRYEMHESRVDTAAAFLEIAGKRFDFGTDFVVRSFASPLSSSLPVVYVGHGWVIPSKGIDPYAGVDVKGKLVLAHGPRALPKDVEVRQIGRITVGATNVVAEAGRRGAAGVVLIPQTVTAEQWTAMRGQNLSRKELVPGVPSAYAGAASTSVLLSRAAAEALLAGERIAGDELLTRGGASDYPPSFQLDKSITLSLPAATTVHRPYNVVGLVEGSDPVLKNEYITIESHLDGAVGARTVDGDHIYNSADDNASGSAANLAIAELMMAGPRPKRSLIFIWDSGEEQGLWGTRHFVGNPPVPLDRIVAHINIDMIGANKAPGSPDANENRVTGPNEVRLIGPGVLSTTVDALLERVNREYLKLEFDRQWDRPESEFFYPRTDAGPFLERGILTIGFTTGIHGRYHLPADEAQALDPKKMEAIARTVFASAWVLADAPERPRIDKPIPETVPRYR